MRNVSDRLMPYRRDPFSCVCGLVFIGNGFCCPDMIVLRNGLGSICGPVLELLLLADVFRIDIDGELDTCDGARRFDATLLVDVTEWDGSGANNGNGKFE